MGRAKYHNIRTQVDGIGFASKAEARRYDQLMLQKRAGEIRAVGLQPSLVVAPGIRYVADFLVVDKDGRVWLEDVKGVETQTFRLKRRLYETAYPGLDLRVIKAR